MGKITNNYVDISICRLKKIFEADGNRFSIESVKSMNGEIMYVHIRREKRYDANYELLQEDLDVCNETMYIYKYEDFTIDKLVKNIENNFIICNYYTQRLDNRKLLYSVITKNLREYKIENLLKNE